MNETTNSLPAQNVDELTDVIDDVEAHGLREVAAAATIGAAVIGAGGVALAASHGSPQTPGPRTPAIVQQALDDSRQLTHDASQGAGQLADSVGGDATTIAGHAVSAVHTAVDPTLQQVGGLASDVKTDATALAQDIATFATTTAGGAVNTATQTADKAVNAATAIATDKVDTATTLATNKLDTATTLATNKVDQIGATVAGIHSTAISLVSATADKVNRGWDLSFNVLGDNVKTGGNMLTPSGTVSVIDSRGHTLASAKVIDGACSIHLSALGQNKTVTVHYSGDRHFGPSTLQWNPLGF